MKRILTVLLLTALAAPAVAGEGLNWTLILGGQAADLGSTYYVLNRCAGCREANPVLGSPFAKLAVAGAVGYGCHALRRRGHGRTAGWLAASFGVVGGAIAVRNLRVR